MKKGIESAITGIYKQTSRSEQPFLGQPCGLHVPWIDTNRSWITRSFRESQVPNVPSYKKCHPSWPVLVQRFSQQLFWEAGEAQSMQYRLQRLRCGTQSNPERVQKALPIYREFFKRTQSIQRSSSKKLSRVPRNQPANQSELRQKNSNFASANHATSRHWAPSCCMSW
jgi:hypothetical protein